MTLHFGCLLQCRLAVVSAGLILAPGLAAGQVRVVIEGGVVLEAGQQPAVPANRPLPPGVGDANSIGDPWWDETADESVAAVAEAELPVEAKDRGRRQVQDRLAAVRRNRGMQVLRRELSRVRAACPDLAPATRAAILAAGREVVDAQAAGREPLVNGLEAGLERALRNHAGSPAADAYLAELEARSARRRVAAIAVLVEVIDRDAGLDAETRERLAAALQQEWRADWEAVTAAAGRRRIGEPSLPVGVVDVAARALDTETFTAWRKRIVEEVER